LRKRGRLELYADILGACLKESKVNEILRKANISFGTFISYAEVLIERGLLIETTNFDRDQRVRFFKTTEKGRKFLLLIEEARKLMGITRKNPIALPLALIKKGFQI